MRGSGNRALTGLSVLVVALCSMLSTVTAWSGDGANVEPSVSTVINFPAFPNDGGPYITQATVRPTSVSGAPATEVLLVFNEDISGASVVAADFVATGFTFTTVGVSGNCVTLDDATGAVSGDMVQLSDVGVITAVDGSLSTDISPFTIGEGPVVKQVIVTLYENDDPNDDEILVVFDANIAYGSGDSENNTFNLTPEFNGTTLASAIEAFADTDDAIRITRDGAATTDFNKFAPGVTKLWVTNSKIVWDAATATDNSVDLKIATNNEGPSVAAAYYNATDAVAWIVMSEPVDPSSFAGDFTVHFTTGGGWSASAGVLSSAFPGLVTSSLLVNSLTQIGPPTEPGSTISNPGSGGDLLDYQGLSGAANTVVVDVGPGIIRAAYDDHRTSTRTDDNVYVWINETIADLGTVGVSDFDFLGFDETGLSLTVVAENLGSISRLTFGGFDNTDHPLPGSRIMALPGNGILGDLTGDELGDRTAICIEDESRPWTLNINEDVDLSYDRFDGVDKDSIFVAWSETGGDDSDQYFMFYTATPGLDDDWMNANLGNAVPLGNLHPEGTDGLIRVEFVITPDVSVGTDGNVLATGDQLRVIIAAADYQGNVARIQDLTESVHVFGPFIVGPLCAPRDYISDASTPAEADSALWDSDVIHVVGDSTGGMVWHYVYGDSLSIPCDADSVLVYDGPDPDADNLLGAGPIGPGGSFAPIHLGSPEVDCIWVFSQQAAERSVGTQIIFDRLYPEILGDLGTPYPDYVFDPWNPYRCYTDGDYVNIRLLAVDPVSEDICVGVPRDGSARRGGPTYSPNPLLHIWGDFSRMDTSPGNITGFGTPADSILFTSLGADLVDNDGDWDTFTDVDGNGVWDVGEPLNDDVGVDGIGGTNDPGEGDGLMTFGDPWVDEDGDGSYDYGETFLNRVTDGDGSSGRLIFDPGETDLDSNDPDEFGWYEVRSSSANVRGTVKQGFPLNNPRPEAELDPYTPVPIYIEDNGIDGARRASSPVRVLPFTDAVPDSNRTLAHRTVHNGGDPERRFAAVIDLQEPTHAEVTYLSNETAIGTTGGDNLIVPGNPVYNLGRFVDFTSSSLSDDDVLYSRVRIRPQMGAWVDLTLDPSPATGGDSDANGDGFPGGMAYDEDSDSTAAQSNAFDDDEDGTSDEEGEGIDYSDREVAAAAQDSTADDAAVYGNGLHCQNDYTDNDNDAFFVYDSYANGGLVGGGAVGKIFWYNIDESRTNNFDDDNDGSIDEADETPENVGYGTGEDDDNEDGIADGEAVAVPLSAFSALAIADPASALWGPPAPGPGVSGTVVWVDAAHVMGRRPVDGNDAANEPFYANELSYGEVVGQAYEVMTVSSRLFPTTGYTFGGAADSASTNEFNWYDTHSSENIDFEVLAEIYGLTADGSTQHQIRAVAYDKCGNVREPWSEPISFTLDLTPPPANIPGCDDAGDPPADFADVRPSVDGNQIYDAGKHPNDYTLTATSDDDAVSVLFEASSDPDFGVIDFSFLDVSEPFTAEWPGGGMYTVNNYPAANADTVYFRARAQDEFGNTTPDDETCILTVIVIDGTNPTTEIVRIHNDDFLHDGACVPPDSSIHIYAEIWDNDEDAGGDTLDWVGGLDVAPGDRFIDDDDDGTVDEDDVDADGIFTWGVDDPGPDGVPGTNDDEWNGANEDAGYAGGGQVGNRGETDDYITNDVVKVVFEYNPVGDIPDVGWLPIETVHGDTFSTGGQTVDWTEPIFATWNTLDLETGDYDIRAWSCDIEGNCDSLTAFLTTVCIRSEPLRAYIQPEVCQTETQFDLYAIHYIHDYEIDKVRFEYFFDADGDNCATALDAGSSWKTIALDDEDTGRGDAVLYMPSPDRVSGAVAIEDLVFVEAMNTIDAGHLAYWDPDHDGYSPRDPVVYDDGIDGIFDEGDDYQVIGDDDEIPDGVALTTFEDDEFYADAVLARGGSTVRPQGWIFRENELNGINGDLDLWMVTWDATGTEEGNYLVHAIAIDEFNQEDVLDYNCYDPASQNPEEVEAVSVDSQEPDSDFTTITLPDGTIIDVSNPAVQPYVAGSNKWLEICAAGSADIARILFEYSLDGGASWTTLDVNNDADFYSDIDDTLGFQALGADEIFNDLNGNFLYDGPEVDFVRYAGDNGVVDTPVGCEIIPLTGEDPAGDGDEDGDGLVDEDDVTGDESPQDYTSPFCVYLDIQELLLWADVNVLFRATASDQICENFREDPDPAVLSVIIGENMPPEADVIRAEDQDGVEMDVWPPIMDDSGVVCIGSDTDTMRVAVTAEDITAIVEVDLWYRLDPSCYPGLPVDCEHGWASMSAEGWTQVDNVYPYDFNVATDLIPDGTYQFFPRAIDEGGNATLPPRNPWEFKKFADASTDFAIVVLPQNPDSAAVGDEYTILAELIDPDAEDAVSVSFYFAPRRLNESIDATLVQPLAPYTSVELDETVLSESGGCDGITLTINGEVGTCHQSLGSVPAPTKLDFRYDAGNNAIVFGARPAGADDIQVSYNFGYWDQIHDGDEFAPYSVEWTAEEGGVPDPGDNGWDAEHTNAYDLIATAAFDINGDWLFDEECDYFESRASEGNYLLLLDTDRPLVQIYGLNFSDEYRERQEEYPDWNWPGNPLFTCGDDINDDTDWDNAAILSGKETDVFVVAEDQGGGSIVSVELSITAENPENGDEDSVDYDMVLYSSASTIDIPVTFYPEDYPQWDPADIENVILYVSTDEGSTYPYKFPMSLAGEGCWQADGRFFVDTVHYYEFEVDLVGDTQERIFDARNNGPDPDSAPLSGSPAVSIITVPDTPFWYSHIDATADFYPARVHHAVATATDDSGNSGNNLNSGTPSDPDDSQGPVVYVYDVDPPVVQAIFANDSDNRPLNGDRITPALSYNIWAAVNDSPYEDFNVLRVDQVQFQYSPNQGGIWLDMDTDTDITDGWNVAWSPVDGSTDGYDNDVDGQWDEDDEKIYTVWIRVVARDCGYNSGYSDAQDPEVLLSLVVDAAEPSACPDTPFDGQVFAYNDVITVSGTAVGDWLPAQGGDDIAEMRFQARFSNLFYVDNSYNGVGHGGDYDNGIDEIWEDSNSNRIWDGGDSGLFAGQDGSFATPDGSATNRWFTLDPTPQDNSDDPWLTSPNNGDAYTITWTPLGSQFTTVSDDGLIDEYVRIRMVATDTAGNEDTDNDDYPPCEKLIILNDDADNNPAAYVMVVNGEWVDPVEKLVIAGLDPVVVGGVVNTATGVSYVNVYMLAEGGEPALIGIAYLSGTEFEVNWDAQDLPQGDYFLFATVVDIDQNESSLDDATRICVRIDREGPSVEYACTDGSDWVSAVSYVDDGIVDHSSFAIHPDQYTWDVLFCVNTPDDDVTGITLQWRYASDPLGLWRSLSELLDDTDDAFDYEPNLNYEDDGETRHVWRLHVEDWPDELLSEGAMHFRALAVDQAGNSNAVDALTNAQELTADGSGPGIYDWNDDSVTNQVEVGSTVNFEITTEDDWTDVTMTQLQYRNLTDGGGWTVYTGDEAPEGVQIDTDYGLWVSRFAWVAPSWVVHDTDYEFRLVAWDSAWNEGTLSPPHSFIITVEDNAAPDRTKLIDVLAQVNYTTEEFEDDEDCDSPDPSEEHREHDVWFDMDQDGEFDEGSDFLVSEGADSGIQDPDGECGIATVGDECNTFPRWVGESFLNDPNPRNEVKIADEVTLVGRTWADDDGIDAGIAYVTFWAQALDGSDNPVGEPRIISRDEVAPFFPLYYWHVTWNTLEADVNGDRVWADGRYRLGAHAIDQEGNEEDMSSLDWTAAIIVVDNEAPEATMDANPATTAIENNLTVERNEWFTLFSRVLVPGTSTPLTTEDNTVTWYYKRHRDLNMPDSWGIVPGDAGVTPEDGNPDETRPYSFDVMVGELTDPTDPINNPFLAVGENYDFVMDVQDEVCNTTSHLSAYGDSTTIGQRSLKVHIVDTIPPHLEFVEAVRALPTRDGGPFGDGDAIPNPTQIHAQAFQSISARLLTGHRDTEYVEFVYRKMGETAWNLIDADLSSPNSTDWVLGNWDLRALEHGQWYEVAAVGVDNVGNVDQSPDILKVYVDYEAPSFAMVHPDPDGNRWCDFEETPFEVRALDLIIEVDRGEGTVNDDVYDVIWEWKLSSADSTEWSESAVAEHDELYDDATNYYSNTIDLLDLDGTELYDLRVTLVDESGNTRRAYLWKQVYDEDQPDYVAISNIHWEGDDTTQDPNDQGQCTDVTAGTLVEVFGTASDDEPELPNERDPQTDQWYETVIALMQFQVAIDIGSDGDANDGEVWRDLGTIQFDPDDVGDISAQTASVLWNTTGLPEDQYLLRVTAVDECGNSRISGVANVCITDNEPPIARIACWDADQQPHGVDPPSLVTVYALAESDPSIVDVQFQYNIVEAGEESPAGAWVNFGVQAETEETDDYTTETIWYSRIDLTRFDSSVTQLWLRALAKDDAGNRYGDDPEDVVPTMLANIVTEFDGTVTFQAVPAAALQNGSEMVEDVEVMIEAQIQDDQTEFILTVKMATAAQTPRVILLRERIVRDGVEGEYPSDDNPRNYSPGTEDGLTRSLNDPTVWRGEIDRGDTDDHCHQYTVCVTGLDGEAGIAKWIDHKGAFIREYDVTDELGTNGTVVTPAYGDLGVSVDIHPGAWIGDDTCMLVSPTWAPLVGHDQSMFITPVDHTAYHIEVQSDFGEFVNGYPALVQIKYNDADVAAALQGANATEADLTIRRWDLTYNNEKEGLGGWTGNGITHIQADTVNNVLTFRVNNLSSIYDFDEAMAAGGDFSGIGNVFQLFVPQESAPVFFASVWPSSPYVSDWWTDADPQFVVYLKDPGGEGIDPDDTELLIDGQIWAAWIDGSGDAEFVRGNGQATLEYANEYATVMAVTYFHSNFARDWLSDGAHTLTVRYKNDSGEWLEGDQVFNVDQKSPYIEFDGGWVDNPDLINIRGYMNPSNDSLHVALYDGGTGVLFKHDRKWYLPDNDCDGVVDADELQFDPMPIYDSSDYGYCWNQVDWGIKYDLWLVDMPEPQEDDQNDIDEIEERTLIHPGTADELAPWVTPRLENYNPATDTLHVPIPVLGGGLIGDGDVLEIVWYAQKKIEANSDGPGDYCYTDSLVVNGDVFYIWDTECQYDYQSQEMHVYQMGITDWAGNTGSRYVEQRFIVDMSAPNCQILSPTATVDPTGDLQIHAVIEDDGAGVDDSAISIRVTDPEGNVVEVEDLEVSDGVITGHVNGPLTRGEYAIRIDARDRLGNKCNVTKTAKAESAVLAMSEAYAFPNPVNPAEANAKIHFSLSKTADVTVKVYDFGGQYVTTLASKQLFDSTSGGVIEWGGEAADGTDLANGTYIVRVTATDGARTEEANLKVVIWRE